MNQSQGPQTEERKPSVNSITSSSSSKEIKFNGKDCYNNVSQSKHLEIILLCTQTLNNNKYISKIDIHSFLYSFQKLFFDIMKLVLTCFIQIRDN